MKKLAKKFLAALLTAIIAVLGMAVMTTTAIAESVFDNAVKMEELEFQSKHFTARNESTFYKIVVPRDGDIIIRWDKDDINHIIHGCSWRLLNSNADEISRGFEHPNQSDTIKKLNKGTYYLEIYVSCEDANIKFYYTFSPTEKPVISLTATIKKGDTLQLGSVTENYDGKVTWLSTKKSIATVSTKGLVTAKKAGTTYIRAQLDNGDYVEIKVVVKKK